MQVAALTGFTGAATAVDPSCGEIPSGTGQEVCYTALGLTYGCLFTVQDPNDLQVVPTPPESTTCAGDERGVYLDPPPKYPVYLPDDTAGLAGMLPADNTDGGTSPCTWTPHNPHYSDGAAGVIAKASWTCSPDVSFTYYYLTLFNCKVQYPTGREGDWVSSGQCYVATKPASGDIQDPGNTSKYPASRRIRYVPKKGDPPGRANGWYIECVQWYYGIGSHEYRGGQITSQPVHITQFPA
jgi:hypothetical protein